jgi:hypothetical protein
VPAEAVPTERKGVYRVRYRDAAAAADDVNFALIRFHGVAIGAKLPKRRRTKRKSKRIPKRG